MHVHGISDLGEGGADGLVMHHEAVEVSAAEPPVAEGAPEDASSKEAIVRSGLKPPKDVTSLGVEGLVVPVYVPDLLLLHNNKQTVICNVIEIDYLNKFPQSPNLKLNKILIPTTDRR